MRLLRTLSKRFRKSSQARIRQRQVSFELGTGFSRERRAPHDGIRILILGGNTRQIRTMIQAHPRAAEVVVAFCNTEDLDHYRKRLKSLAKKQSFVRFEDVFGEFDYIAWHPRKEDIPEVLQSLRRMLKPNGVLKLETLPPCSFLYERKVIEYFTWEDPSERVLRSRELQEAFISKLPTRHPLRRTYESVKPRLFGQALAQQKFFSMLSWQRITEGTGFRLVAEGQTRSNRSSHLEEIFRSARTLDPWKKAPYPR